MAQEIQVPLIGQTNAAFAQLRLQIAVGVLNHLSAIEFAESLRRTIEQDQAIGGDGSKLEFNMHTGMVAGAAVAYADALLVHLGIAKPAG